jgi:hypothetical protein
MAIGRAPSCGPLRRPVNSRHCKQRELWRADEAKTLRARNGLRSPLDVELNEDMLDVRFDGLGCDGKNSCNFLVGSSRGYQAEDIAFPRAKRLFNCGGRSLVTLGLIARTITLD